MNRSYLLNAFLEQPWAILPHKLVLIQEIVMRHVNGEKLDPEEVQARIHGASRPSGRRVPNGNNGVMQAVAVLPLFGTIFPRANMMTDYSGGTSADAFGKQFDELVNDPGISAIVLDVDSPGGRADGIDELSAKIYNARGTKPIVAVANHLMASAAYWIGTSADELVVSPSSEVGSIGAFAAHEDISAALEQDGIKVTLISEGKYKVEGNPYEPLGDEARGAIQARVREVYEAFVEAVARNRGVSEATVLENFGQGRMVGARRAVELGMADRVETLDETVMRLLDRNGKKVSGGIQGERVESPEEHLTSEYPVTMGHEAATPVLTAEAQSLREDISQFLASLSEAAPSVGAKGESSNGL